MYDFISSIANIIGEYINKLIDFLSNKKEKPKTVMPIHVAHAQKPSPWTKKKK